MLLLPKVNAFWAPKGGGGGAQPAEEGMQPNRPCGGLLRACTPFPGPRTHSRIRSDCDAASCGMRGSRTMGSPKDGQPKTRRKEFEAFRGAGAPQGTRTHFALCTCKKCRRLQSADSLRKQEGHLKITKLPLGILNILLLYLLSVWG